MTEVCIIIYKYYFPLATSPDPSAAERAVRMLVLADLFGYNRQLPSLAWRPAEELAEATAPGALVRIRGEVGVHRAPALREEALRLVTELA